MKVVLSLLLCCSAPAVAQLPTTSPVKLGLWQSEGTTKIPSAGMPETSEVKTIRTCVGKDTWQSFMGQAGEQMKSCEKKNATYSNRTYVVDMVCGATDPTGSSTAHLEMTFDTTEAAHASMKMELRPASGPVLHVTSSIKTHYVADSCGDLQPGEEKDVP